MSLGSLVSGRGSRSVLELFLLDSSNSFVSGSYILANTERLHEKIVQMSERIRDLENALCTLHAQHCLCSGQSVSSHPLLQGPQLLVKAHLELYGIESSRSSPDSPTSMGSSDAPGDPTAPNASISNSASDGQSVTSNEGFSALPTWLDTMSFGGSSEDLVRSHFFRVRSNSLLDVPSVANHFQQRGKLSSIS